VNLGKQAQIPPSRVTIAITIASPRGRPITKPHISEANHTRPTSIWLPYLLPPRSDEAIVLAESGIAATPEGEDLDIVSSSLRRLLDETSDLIDSPNSSAVMGKMLDAGFDFLLEKLADGAFKQKAMALPAVIPADSRTTPVSDDDDGEEKALMEGDSATTKFASVLAVLARQGHLIGNGVPNEYLQVCFHHLSSPSDFIPRPPRSVHPTPDNAAAPLLYNKAMCEVLVGPTLLTGYDWIGY